MNSAQIASNTGLGIASEAIRIVVEPNTFVFIGGRTSHCSSWGGPMATHRKDHVLAHDNRTYLSFQPVKDKTAYIPLFESTNSGSVFENSGYARDFRATKAGGRPWTLIFLVSTSLSLLAQIHTKDEGDNDCQDITLTVALIGASKAITLPTGIAPLSNGSGIPKISVSTTQIILVWAL
ncbi:hypothetical protein B0H14DRAFT_3691515 [Mycena olivaceomarginata]|nr:hypothetical protein B0H14DRAFT_3691515 [Mycena olivaceomarginata]